MGCAPSSSSKSSDDAASSAVSSFDRRPKISVRIEDNVHKFDNEVKTPKVIFVFGGPGSRKGHIVDDLMSSYGFHFISGEDVIMKELPKKVANVMKLTTTKDVKDLIEDDPSHVTLEWLLQLVERRIERTNLSKDCVYLVDIIPNLKLFLRQSALIKDCKPEMDKFEARYPVSFALNLAIPADRVLNSQQVFCAKPETSEKMKETGGTGDEADTGRMKRRADLYVQASKTFLDYFSETQRLVTVDVTCGIANFIWHRVHQLLCDLEFQPKRTVNTVILFAFEQEIGDVDTDKYYMEEVKLKNIVLKPNDTVENLLSALCKYIDNQSHQSDSFVVILEGTSINRSTMQKIQKSPIIFLDPEVDVLQNYFAGSPKNITKNGRQFKAVHSVENEKCLFPIDVDDSVCRQIAACMAANRSL